MKNKINFKKLQTIDDLESLKIGHLIVDISHRGGKLGFYSKDISKFFNIDGSKLPSNFGVFVNYLGGGVRGNLVKSDIYELTEKEQKKVIPLMDAIYRIYLNTENEIGLNDTEYDDGDTNWDAVATQSARKNKIISAY